MSKQRKSNLDKYSDDAELWESKKLGADPRYARRVSDAYAKEIDESLGLQAISIRLQIELVEQLKELAKRDGIGYQPYIRQILTRHVRQARKRARDTA
jgi:predicted DNA binding CopG/RHH family protein